MIVTGLSGFIGQHLHRALSQAGTDVLKPTDALGGEPVDALVHLAFPTDAEYRRTQPERALADTLATTSKALALVDAYEIRHVILASTGKVYAPTEALPITERHPTRPTTFLGELKLLVERSLALAAAHGRSSVTSLRIFNVYGPGQRGDFLFPRLLEQLSLGTRVVLGELDHARDWIHVRDACAAFVCALRHPPPPATFRALNVASGSAASVRRILSIAEEVLGCRLAIERDPGRLRPAEVSEERASAKPLQELGWNATMSLAEGARELFGALRAEK